MKKDHSELIARYKAGDSVSLLAQIFNYSESSIRRISRKAGLPPREFQKAGIRLTDEDRKKIFVRYKNGELLSSIAKDFNCAISWVRHVARLQGAEPRCINTPMTKEQRAKVVDALRNDIPYYEIAMDWLISYRQVTKIAAKEGLLRRQKRQLYVHNQLTDKEYYKCGE